MKTAGSGQVQALRSVQQLKEIPATGATLVDTIKLSPTTEKLHKAMTSRVSRFWIISTMMDLNGWVEVANWVNYLLITFFSMTLPAITSNRSSARILMNFWTLCALETQVSDFNLHATLFSN